MPAVIDDSQSSSDSNTREKMKSYWKVYKPSLESMMLNNDAKYLAENEQNELLSYLPSFEGQRVLELGAGIGRFTSKFANLATHVTAVDFIESYVEENKRANEHYKNIAFRCADVTKLDFEDCSFDLIFTNWLFMYLTTSEVEAVFAKILRWLSPNGHFFIRESCYHPSGNVPRPENPSKYRTPLEYFSIFSQCTNKKSFFNIKFAKNVLTYIHHYGNPNQLCILSQRKSEERQMLQDYQIDPNVSLCHHQLLGPIVKESGPHSVKSFGSKLSLQERQRVLHVGCGIGDIPMELAENFGCYVHGFDLSPAKIHKAIERQGKLPLKIRKKMQFEYCNELTSKWAFTFEGYEAIICTDILQQISDVNLFIKKLKESLKPGGKILIADYFTPSPARGHLSNEGYLGKDEIESILKAESFRLEETISDSDCSISTLKKRSNVASNGLEEEFKPLLAQLQEKISVLEGGSLKWIKFFASI